MMQTLKCRQVANSVVKQINKQMLQKTSREDLDRVIKEYQFEQKRQRDLKINEDPDLEDVRPNQMNNHIDSQSDSGTNARDKNEMTNTMSQWRQETQYEKNRRIESMEREKQELNIKENEEVRDKQVVIQFNELIITQSNKSVDFDTQLPDQYIS